MKVSYHCGLRMFHEYVSLDHGGYAARLARQWWEMRKPREWPIPPSVHDGMKAINYLRVPKAITVQFKGKFDDIVGFEFNGDI
jgi:DNA repair protein RadD